MNDTVIIYEVMNDHYSYFPCNSFLKCLVFSKANICSHISKGLFVLKRCLFYIRLENSQIVIYEYNKVQSTHLRLSEKTAKLTTLKLFNRFKLNSVSLTLLLKQTTGILPCRSLGSDGRIAWRTFEQNRHLDAILGQRLLVQERVQETARTTFGPPSVPEELEEVPQVEDLALVQTVAESQASPQRHPYRGRDRRKLFSVSGFATILG